MENLKEQIDRFDKEKMVECYVAAWIDAEGNIDKRGNKVRITNTCLSVLILLNELLFKFFGFRGKIRVVRRKHAPLSRKPQYVLDISARARVLPLLEKLRDYFVVKKERAASAYSILLTRRGFKIKDIACQNYSSIL